MAHNIFGNRFYGHREPAWHGLGIVSKEEKTGIEALNSLGGGYWMEKRPVTVTLNNIPTETGDFAIVRSPLPDDPQECVFGYTTDRYNILQPLEAVELFDEKVSEPVETIGMLGKGERLFLTWKLPETEIVKDDIVQWYGFCAIGFDGVMGASLNVVTTRVVCQNTYTAAIAEAMQEKKSNKGRIYAGKHTSKNMKFELGEWMNHIQSSAKKQVELTNSFFKQLTKVPLTDEKEVYRLLFTAYPDPKPLPEDYPSKLRASKEEKLEMEKKLMTQYRDGIASLFFGHGTAITQDYWGIFNSATEFFNWGMMEKKPANLSIMMGQRATRMNQMAEVLLRDMNG